MNLKKWSYLFWTTLCLGGAVMLITGLSMQLYQNELSNLRGPADVLMNIFQLILSGFTISVFAQMGFFAYLTLNLLANGMFRRAWPYIQVVLTVIVLLDVMFLRTLLGQERDLIQDVVLGLTLLVFSVGIGIVKMKITTSSALIPTLFYMIVGTTIEMTFALNMSPIATWFLFIPLVACNAYQILILSRVLEGRIGKNKTNLPQGAGFATKVVKS
ncbi:KinB-signaling pathway activation protein [Paenibacillus sp. SC116]|uniref:KinB-signaling pathway activation protein n=1 Tax=Paenibacillus sp. SC116 TaxID=2968986 RepID=UPI00215AB989|nr:KinB-signaling pathway activation protein [Paenibacillus sp. SC116]MCR8846747.1 KinB-signaling pathway activation protein [Paenibacillus sp. SC116]